MAAIAEGAFAEGGGRGGATLEVATFEVGVVFSEVTCDSCGNRFPFDSADRCSSCRAILNPDEHGDIDPIAASRRREWNRLAAALRGDVNPAVVELDDASALSWLNSFTKEAMGFMDNLLGLAEAISIRSGAPTDDDDLVEVASRLRRIADTPYQVAPPEAWRLVHSLLRGTAKSLRGILIALADAIQCGLAAGMPPVQDDLQLHMERAGTLLPNLDLALAGIQARVGVPLASVVSGLAQGSIADTTDRFESFARHYFKIAAEIDLPPDVAIALGISALGLETTTEPDRLQRVAQRMCSKVSQLTNWTYPARLQDELILANERVQNAAVVLEVLERELDDVLLHEEKARLVSRLAEEGLRPLLAVLTYFHEGVDDPARYEFLRLTTLKTLISGLEPRLRDREKFLASFPLDYRHAYAHGGISNDGENVIFELIEPPRRITVAPSDIDAVLDGLTTAFAVLTPVVLLGVQCAMPQRPSQTVLPRRSLAQQAEVLFAYFGIDGTASVTRRDVALQCLALPARPKTLLSYAVGLAAVAPDKVLKISPPGGPEIQVPLRELDIDRSVMCNVLFLRFKLLTRWISPPLLQADRAVIDRDLVVPLGRVLNQVLAQARDTPDESKDEPLATLMREAQTISADASGFLEQSARGRRLRSIASLIEGAARCDGAQADHGLMALNLELHREGLNPTLFGGEL